MTSRSAACAARRAMCLRETEPVPILGTTSMRPCSRHGATPFPLISPPPRTVSTPDCTGHFVAPMALAVGGDLLRAKMRLEVVRPRGIEPLAFGFVVRSHQQPLRVAASNIASFLPIVPPLGVCLVLGRSGNADTDAETNSASSASWTSAPRPPSSRVPSSAPPSYSRRPSARKSLLLGGNGRRHDPWFTCPSLGDGRGPAYRTLVHRPATRVLGVTSDQGPIGVRDHVG